jgi:hypothetical protein
MLSKLTRSRLLLAGAGLALAASVQAQVANCTAPASAGILTPPSSTTIAPGDLTPPPTLSGYSGGLPDFDFALINPNDIVFNADSTISGPRFLDANKTGVFDPAAYGLGDGDQVCILYVTYDRAVIRSAVDEILNGSFLFTPCCALIPTFVPDVGDICAALNAAGIFGPSDVNDLNDVFALTLALEGAPCFEGLQNTIDVEINPLIASGTPCTGGTLLCYTLTSTVCYDIVGSTACNSAVTPSNQSHTTLSNRVQLDWDPQPGAVACQVQGKRLPTGPQPSVNILSGDISTTNVPFTVAGAGTTWTWRVRCACSISPLDLSAYSAYGDTFSIPLAREAALVELTELFPNPATDRVTVALEAGADREVSVTVTDLLGRTVLQREVAVTAGQNRFELALPDLPSGLYLLRAGNAEARPFEVR